jgi:hypothetical protein
VEGLTGRSAAAVQHMLLEENLRIQCGSLPRRKSMASPGTSSSSMSSGFTLLKSKERDSSRKNGQRSINDIGHSGKYTINNEMNDLGVNGSSSQHFEISEKILFRGNNIEISESESDLDKHNENGFSDEKGVRTNSFPSYKLKTEKCKTQYVKNKITSKDAPNPPPAPPIVWEIG